MPWVKLDDAILDNPKIIAAGPLGFAMHVAAITWCARNLTDGWIPKRRVGLLLDLPSLQVTETTKVRVLHALTADDLAADLERLQLWHDRGHAWEVHDYLVYNPSRAQVLAEREATRKRVATLRDRRRKPCNAVTNTHVTVAPVPVPVPGSSSPDLLPGIVETPLARVGGGVGEPQSRATRAQRATTWPEHFRMTDAHVAQARRLGVEMPWEWEKFRDHHQAKGSRFTNWEAAWRTWLRNTVDFELRRRS